MCIRDRYLYGGDSFTKEEGEDYQTYDGENGISVTYDANIWNEPSMSQEDTIGITTGNKLSYTAVPVSYTHLVRQHKCQHRGVLRAGLSVLRGRQSGQ